MNNVIKYIIIVLEMTLLFSLVVSINRLTTPDEEITDEEIADEENADNVTEETPSGDNADEETPSEDEVVTEVDFSTMSYVAFGDSITFGADYTLNYSQMADPYPELVSQALGLSSYTNKAVSGATFCTNTLNRVCMTDRVLAHTEQANIISVMLGVNDYSASLPLGKLGDTTSATIYGSLYLIAEHLTTTQEDAFIFFMTPYKCKIGTKTYKDKNNAGYVLEDVANAIKEVGAKYNIPVLDLFNEGQYELEMYSYGSDGIHPSQEFIREYTAPQIEAFIRQNYGK